MQFHQESINTLSQETGLFGDPPWKGITISFFLQKQRKNFKPIHIYDWKISLIVSQWGGFVPEFFIKFSHFSR